MLQEAEDASSQPYEIPRNILAFRLITKTLNDLSYAGSPPLNDWGTNWSESEKHEVRISDAFAHLASAEHDVVAIATNRRSLHRAMEGKTTLGIIACINSSNLESSEAKPGAAPSCLFNKENAQWNDHERSRPTFILPVEPSNFHDFAGLKEYMRHLQFTNWEEPTLSSHIWILAKLLVDLKQNANDFEKRPHLLGQFYIYVLSACCRKMDRRFKSKQSAPYFQALAAVNARTFEYSAVEEPLNANKKSRGDVRREKNETYNDLMLLKTFAPLTETIDKPPLLTNKFPNLVRVAALATSDKILELYTDDTCMEFHKLLVELLEHFRDVLDKLSDLNQRAKKDPGSMDMQAFQTYLHMGRVYGYTLMRIARGRAFRKHMENIEPLLKEYTATSDPGMTAEDQKAEGKDETEANDTELEAIQTGKQTSNGSLSMRYGAWLRLMVEHFEEVDLLANHVTGANFPFDDISIKILIAPTITNAEVLPWYELITDSKLFPTCTLDNNFMPASHISNDGIGIFLTKAIKKANATRLFYGHVQAVKKNWNPERPWLAIDPLTRLQKSIPEDSVDPKDLSIKSTLSYILEQINKRSRNGGDPAHLDWEELSNRLEDVYARFCPPTKTDLFYLKLDEPRILRTHVNCEDYLASLLDNFTEIVDITSFVGTQTLLEMKGYGQAIGVSQRRCPVSMWFLKHIKPVTPYNLDEDRNFLVRGYHSRVTGCTLPPWTPSEVVDSIVHIFGYLLSKELVFLMEQQEQQFI